jgi:hypothetical protein
MSHDPENGNRMEPKSLHKYLYADENPVSGIDPTERLDLANMAKILLGLRGMPLWGLGLGHRHSAT